MNPSTSTPNSIARPNPFATTSTRPGAIEFLVDQDEFLPDIVDSFRENRFLGQIVGPHGCGKTTLTFAIEKALSHEFDSCRRVTIRGPRDASSSNVDLRSGVTTNQPTRNQLLIVDGVERLSWLHQRILVKHFRENELALIITVHKRIHGVPLLCTLNPEFSTFIRLVRQLAPQLEVDPAWLNFIFQQNRGDIREALMDLYDWFEHRRRNADSA